MRKLSVEEIEKVVDGIDKYTNVILKYEVKRGIREEAKEKTVKVAIDFLGMRDYVQVSSNIPSEYLITLSGHDSKLDDQNCLIRTDVSIILKFKLKIEKYEDAQHLYIYDSFKIME